MYIRGILGSRRKGRKRRAHAPDKTFDIRLIAARLLKCFTDATDIFKGERYTHGDSSLKVDPRVVAKFNPV